MRLIFIGLFVVLTCALGGVLWFFVSTLQENSVKLRGMKVGNSLHIPHSFAKADEQLPSVDNLPAAPPNLTGLDARMHEKSTEVHHEAKELYQKAFDCFGEMKFAECMPLCRQSIERLEDDFAHGRTTSNDNRILSSRYTLIARCEMKLQHYKEALEAAQKASSIFPDNPYNYSVQADCYARWNDRLKEHDARTKEQAADKKLDPHTRAMERLLGEGFEDE